MKELLYECKYFDQELHIYIKENNLLHVLTDTIKRVSRMMEGEEYFMEERKMAKKERREKQDA